MKKRDTSFENEEGHEEMQGSVLNVFAGWPYPLKIQSMFSTEPAGFESGRKEFSYIQGVPSANSVSSGYSA